MAQVAAVDVPAQILYFFWAFGLEWLWENVGQEVIDMVEAQKLNEPEDTIDEHGFGNEIPMPEADVTVFDPSNSDLVPEDNLNGHL